MKKFIGIFVALSILMALNVSADVAIESGSDNIAYIGYRDCPSTDSLTGLPVPNGFAPDGTKTVYEKDNFYYDGINFYPWEGELCQEGQDPYIDECWPDPDTVVGHTEAFACLQTYDSKLVVWIHAEPNFGVFGDTIRFKKNSNTWSNFDFNDDGVTDYSVPDAGGAPFDISPLYSPQRPGTPIGKHDPNWNSNQQISVGREFAVLVPEGVNSITGSAVGIVIITETSMAMFSSTENPDFLASSVKSFLAGQYVIAPEFTVFGVLAALVIAGGYIYKKRRH